MGRFVSICQFHPLSWHGEQHFVQKKRIYSSAQFSLSLVSLLDNNLDRASATFVVPGLYITLNLYGRKRKTHLSILADGLDLKEYITSSGLWSVTNSNSVPYNVTETFHIPKLQLVPLFQFVNNAVLLTLMLY